jgi:prepilin-type N-terminal cleavage/methylation domain-containing protein
VRNLSKNGFGLVETLVGVAVFTIIALAAYKGYAQIMRGVQVLKVKTTATNLANEQIEIIKNLPYVDVGIVDGLPAGKIPRDQTLDRGGIDFLVNTSIRDIDDPFDGQIGEEPNDLSPADYKLVEITISCSDCSLDSELKYYAHVAALNLETQGDNGALFIQVLDANGQPIQGADVHVFNNEVEDIDIDETTNNSGMFQIVDAPPGTGAYEIIVSKGNDYSTDQTYTIGDPGNPVPDKPHANVSMGEVTQVTFSIDKLSELDIYTRTNTCEAIPYIDFNIHGSKTVGLDVYKTDYNEGTGSSGNIVLDDIEWDNYYLTINSSTYSFAGSSPLLPLQVNPDSSHLVDIILTPKDPNALLLKIIDPESQLPISDAQVTLLNEDEEYTLTTDKGFLMQSDWSGGSGQEYYEDETRYYLKDGGINISTEGEISLSEFGGTYSSSGVLESSIFDTGSEINFGNIFWNPVDQPIDAGDGSIRFQIATNAVIDETTTWTFLGPDGTSDTYYTNSGQGIGSIHHGDRYFKYKVFLQTDSIDVTPVLANVSITFLSECAPPGQVFFKNLDEGEYSVVVEHNNYETAEIDGIVIDSEWTEYEINLIPE